MGAGMGKLWSQSGTIVASFMVVYSIFKDYFPYQLRAYLARYGSKLMNLVYPYVQITFHEYIGERFNRSEVYGAITTYLSACPASTAAKKLKADDIKHNKSLTLSMDYNEEITEEFQGAKLWWTSCKDASKSQSFSYFPASDEKRYYRLTFHRRYKDLIAGSYLNHNSGNGPKKKEEIINDLDKFRQGKDYYSKIGKAWKRGYLLYGPPGTGKSTMIAAMANYLEYDIYDLELTAVKDNTDLKKLLIDTSNKSIIVIEDIDCSLDLTGQREKKKEKSKRMRMRRRKIRFVKGLREKKEKE
ncbi:hypothetical protein FNV43_RR14428 [Rhamnella rubrinervis]|uniref:Uncharacterized protein n=1 Tax=Rhamnella rubrinervis TaxID=2594499 RepID=A0A8K0H389_9ROSA|nr:hypothetical protein FNV43_RR14428 [Rhamnella rubrinervis]